MATCRFGISKLYHQTVSNISFVIQSMILIRFVSYSGYDPAWGNHHSRQLSTVEHQGEILGLRWFNSGPLHQKTHR